MNEKERSYVENGAGLTPVAENEPSVRGSYSQHKKRIGIVVNAPFVKIRKEPTGTSEALRSAQKGERIQIIGEEGDFFEVISEGNIRGYMVKHFLSESND